MVAIGNARWNVLDSDGTAILFNQSLSGGFPVPPSFQGRHAYTGMVCSASATVGYRVKTSSILHLWNRSRGKPVSLNCATFSESHLGRAEAGQLQ